MELRRIIRAGVSGAVVPVAVVLALLSAGARASAQVTSRVSLDASGVEGNASSFSNSLSADGRFVAFQSSATNLVANDTNGRVDLFVRDRRMGTTERVSVASTGAEGDGDSSNGALSADGRFVAFESAATGLVAGDSNGFVDVFVRDRLNGTTERVSVDSTGAQANSASARPALSADGRFVTFMSDAGNLVANDGFGSQDVFVHDRQTGTTEIASVDSAGVHGNKNSYASSISADGRIVGFYSFATNLVANDSNGVWDVFVHDRTTGATEIVSVDSTGGPGDFDSYSASLSADGRFVAFQSFATTLVPLDGNRNWDAFVRDRQAGTTERVSVSTNGTEGNLPTGVPSISGDGRLVVFQSFATNLVAGDTNAVRDVFLRDRPSATTTRVSVDSAGAQANDGCDGARISADGRFVAFYSAATNLVAGDNNNQYDTFVHGPWLTLDVDPAAPTAGDTLTVASYTGEPSGALLLVAVGVNGVPLFQPLVAGSFDATGLFVFSAAVPGGLAGIDVTLELFGFVTPTRVAASNRVDVPFQ